MPHILKNRDLEIHIDLPTENYNASRFDWTGKISDVKFKDIPMSSRERSGDEEEHQFGKGFYNEFGIDTPLGFNEAAIGGWFHKIGVGLLKKTSHNYECSALFEIQPAQFDIKTGRDQLQMSCTSETVNGYAYALKKEIELQSDGFTITYALKNSGEKDIRTDEYVHNFLAMNTEGIGCDYILKFPFQLHPLRCIEFVNPEHKVDFGQEAITFNDAIEEVFFFSNLSGFNHVQAQWELHNMKNNITIRETGSFLTDKVNLWGASHVMSPELFYSIDLAPDQTTQWSRRYTVYNPN